MDALNTIFARPDVAHWRQVRLSRVQRALQPTRAEASDMTGGELPLDLAVSHHMLEGAEAAARKRDLDAFAWCTARTTADFDELSIRVADTRHLVLSPDLGRMARSEISQSPYYLLEPHSRPVEHDLRILAAQALQVAHDAGFGPLVADHAAIICLLCPRRLGATLASWTITRLPGTVFTDHVGDPVVLARDLIHEAGHNWLNVILAAREVTIPDSPELFSPWKNQPRPPFGFLHACWAFPLTMLFTARALDSSSGPVTAFLTAYLGQQRALLAQTADAHPTALELIGDLELRDALAAIYQAARSL
jgi:hypothetical protein